MGFTIEDMMLHSKETYKMEMVAGHNGWSNSISWVHMIEDTTIIRHFWGKELAVTMAMGFQTEEELLRLVQDLVKYHAAGLIINVGGYIEKIPESVIQYCDENDLPLVLIPWEIYISDVVKDFSIRVFMQDDADETITQALQAAIEQPQNVENYRTALLPHFDVDGDFQVVLVSTEGLAAMDTVERKKLYYRVQVYFENITHNGNLFYYDSYFVLVANAVEEAVLLDIVEGMMKRAKKRLTDVPLYVGMGTLVRGIANLFISYERAKAAVSMAMRKKTDMIKFENMGIYRLLYSITDPLLLKEMSEDLLKPLIEYDEKHNGNYVETLEMFLRYNGSIQAIAENMYTHRNTVIYRITNIKKLLNSQIDTPEERLPYQIAFYIRNM